MSNPPRRLGYVAQLHVVEASTGVLFPFVQLVGVDLQHPAGAARLDEDEEEVIQ